MSIHDTTIDLDEFATLGSALLGVYDGDGYALTQGLQPASACDEAAMVAQSIADRRGETVYLSPCQWPEDEGEAPSIAVSPRE